MKEFLINFFTAVPVWELVMIVVLKAIEVAMGTTRHILVNKGFRKQGALIAFFEIILWVFNASTVINNISAAPIKGLMYAGGYALGVLLGSRVENILAFGKVLIQTNTTDEFSEEIACLLREHGIGVTAIEGKGKNSKRIILMTYANRKGKDNILKFINDIDPDAMITITDVSTLRGGVVSNWKNIVK